jgi:hypothetical protein
VTAGALRPAHKVIRDSFAGDGIRRALRAARGGLPGRDAERLGMGPAVVLSKDLTEPARPVRHGAPANLAAGDRQLGDGHGEATCSYTSVMRAPLG